MLYALYTSIDRGAWVVMVILVAVTGALVAIRAVPPDYLRDLILLMGAYLLGRASRIRSELRNNASISGNAQKRSLSAEKGGGGIDISSNLPKGAQNRDMKVEDLSKGENNGRK